MYVCMHAYLFRNITWVDNDILFSLSSNRKIIKKVYLINRLVNSQPPILSVHGFSITYSWYCKGLLFSSPLHQVGRCLLCPFLSLIFSSLLVSLFEASTAPYE